MSEFNPWRRMILSNRYVALSLLPGIGGRVMNVHFRGEPLLFENPDSLDFRPDLAKLSEVPSRASHLPFPLWGGEKTWIAPESAWPAGGPHPVLDSGPYDCRQLSDSTVCMTSAVCPSSSLQIVRTVALETDEPGWVVEHELINRADSDRTCGIWSVMMVRRPASIRCQLPVQNDVAVLMGDPGTAVSRSGNQVEVTCDQANEFKIGAHPSSCSAEVLFPGRSNTIVLTVEASSIAAPGDYAHGHALEVYNSAVYAYAELEWHAPARTLAPGEASSFSIRHQLKEETL